MFYDMLNEELDGIGRDLLNKLMKAYFDARGYDETYIEQINHVNHDRLKDLDLFVSLLYQAYESKAKIVILPDFDMDGIMSGVLGFVGLAELGFHVGLYMPPTDSYGFDEKTCKDLLAQFPDTEMVITCDVGTSAFEGVDYLKRQGIQVLVTDHHQQTATGLKADVLINPMRLDETYAHPQICGAHVLYQAIMAYAEAYADEKTLDRLRLLRVFAGLGTVSDMMPIVYENRGLVRDAIAITQYIYNNGDASLVDQLEGSPVYRKVFRSFYDLIKVCEEHEKIRSIDSIDEEFFGFYLAPMFNSIRRLGVHSKEAFAVFFDGESLRYANGLYDYNIERKALVLSIYEETLKRGQALAPVIYFTEASSGLLGLIANMLMQRSGLPTLTLVMDDDGTYHGSGRSPSWYPMASRLRSIEVYAQGHEQAFGVRFDSFGELSKAYDFLFEDIKAYRDSIGEEEDKLYDALLVPTQKGFYLDEDEWLSYYDIKDYLRCYNLYRPFGVGFEKPEFGLYLPAGSYTAKQIGKEKNHLKLIVKDNGLEILCWNDVLDDDTSDVLIVGDFQWNEFLERWSINFYGNVVRGYHV